MILDSADIKDMETTDVLVDDTANNWDDHMVGYEAQYLPLIKIQPASTGKILVRNVLDVLVNRNERNPNIIFINMPLTQSHNRMRDLYAHIEEVKGGWSFYTGRNSYREWWFNKPRVWVLTNQEPNTADMPDHKWRFWRIVGEQLQQYTPES